MMLALVAALASAAAVAAAFGVPARAGALVLLDVAAIGALAGALVATAAARLRARPVPLRTLGGSALAAAAGAAHLTFAPAAPAVIVMVVDCLRADRLSEQRMPRVFARADDAVRFTRARAQSSWTRSAMPSLLSGRYPTEHGLYRTNPPDRIRDDVTLLAERYTSAGWLTAAFVQQPQLDAAFGYDRGFGRYGYADGRAPDLNERFLAWNALFRTVPRFVLVHYLDVHAPYTPGKAFRPKDLPPTKLALRPYTRWRETVEAIERGAIVPTDLDWAHLAALYDAEVRQVDARIDTVLDRLEADGTLDASWFVFTADHGERFGEHGRIGHMGPLDEAVLAVPLLIRPPGGGTRRTVNDPVQHVDVVPTLLAATGLPADPSLPGRDLGPALRGEPLPAAPLFAEEWARDTHHASVTHVGWKLIRGDKTRLYDLAADPAESDDLADTHPDERARLEGLLSRYFTGTPALSGATAEWEAAAAARRVWTPAASPESTLATPSEETVRALEALGYTEGGE